jgi:hypothetical protein
MYKYDIVHSPKKFKQPEDPIHVHLNSVQRPIYNYNPQNSNTKTSSEAVSLSWRTTKRHLPNKHQPVSRTRWPPTQPYRNMWLLMRRTAATLRLKPLIGSRHPGPERTRHFYTSVASLTGASTGLYGFDHLKSPKGFQRFVDDAIER